MKEIFEKTKTKKISHNINEKTLEMIDELAKITESDRTKILNAIIFSGIKSQTNFMIKEWENLLKQREYKSKKKRIGGLLEKIKNFKKKWTINEIPS